MIDATAPTSAAAATAADHRDSQTAMGTNFWYILVKLF